MGWSPDYIFAYFQRVTCSSLHSKRTLCVFTRNTQPDCHFAARILSGFRSIRVDHRTRCQSAIGYVVTVLHTCRETSLAAASELIMKVTYWRLVSGNSGEESDKQWDAVRALILVIAVFTRDMNNAMPKLDRVGKRAVRA